MKQKLTRFLHAFVAAMKSLWEIASRHWVLKLLSVIFAVLIWNFVLVQTNPNRVIRVSDIGVTIQNESMLAANGLTLAEPYDFVIGNIWVALEVPLNEVDRAAQSVTAWIDLRNITQTGTVTVPIHVSTTTSGTVVNKSMDTIQLQVEKLENRTFSVEMVGTGSLADGYYIDSYTVSPQTVSIKGPESMLNIIDKVYVSLPLEEISGSYSGIHSVLLTDAEGRILDDTQLSITNKDSISLKMTVYLQKTLEILLDDALIGREDIPEGYELTSLTTRPISVSVYGDPDVVAAMNGVNIATVDLKGLSTDQIFERKLKLPAGVQCNEISSVDVIIRISEKTTTRTISDVQVRYSRLPSGYVLTDPLPTSVTVQITGPEKLINSMTAASILVSADLSSCVAGENDVELIATVDSRYRVTEIIITPVSVKANVSDVAGKG